MTLIKKVKSPVFIITASFYVFLLFIPSFVQKDIAGADVYRAFFMNSNMNIALCLVPAALGMLFCKKDIANRTFILATTDALVLFLIFVEFFVSANYYLNLLTAIFIFFFILININELFAVLGIIPFFFLSDLDIFHYALTVALPLISLIIIKLSNTENRMKKNAMRITLFIQGYICIFFVALLVTDIYRLNITATSPQYITAQFIIGTVACIALLLFIFICVIINVFRNEQIKKVTTKLFFTLSAFIITAIGITGYFTDILSTENRTSILISLIYLLIFNTQHNLSFPTEQKYNKKVTDIITVTSAILFCIGMIN